MRLQLVSKDDTVTCVTASGQITQDAFHAEEEPLASAWGEEIYGARLLLNLQDAEYIDSRGVGWILKCHRRFRSHGGTLVIHSLPPMIKEVLKVLHLDDVFLVSDDAQSARDKALGSTHV